MASVDLTAGQVMDASAALLNDAAKTVYTYAIQIPYLNIAMDELQEVYELNSIPVSEQTSSVIPVDANKIEIVFNASPGNPALPNDFVEAQQLWERTRNIDPFIPMIRRNYLPHNLEGVQSNQLIYWIWQDQRIKFLPANQDNDVKIDYIREFFSDVTSGSSTINVINARTFLEYRTAGLISEFIEKNISNANSQNSNAVTALDRALGIGIKGKQLIFTRRRPFRSAYKRRGRFFTQ
jgi:hypothetical protein